ncbi:MAG: Spy/CpxP family protein refolding chaperone [Gemmatimonadaceae bacterium]
MLKVRTLALGALMVVGVAGVSAAQSTATPPARANRSAQMGPRRGPGGREGFGGLNLTEAQKTQMKAIRQKYQPQNTAVRNQAKPYMDAAKAARQKGDTAAARSNFEKARQIQEGASYRSQEQAEIRAVLTPEQQAKWDASQKARADRAGKKGWGHKRAGAADKK